MSLTARYDQIEFVIDAALTTPRPRAFVDGRMRAGAGIFTDGHGLARFQSVETHPGFRRRGLDSAVIRHAGERALQRPGMHTLVIVAEPDNDGIRLYRALGFAETERQVQVYRG